MEEDPEGFKEYRRGIQNKSQKKYAARKRAEMTPEELIAFKAKEAERIRKYRAKKKAEKAKSQLEKMNEQKAPLLDNMLIVIRQRDFFLAISFPSG